MNTVKGDLAFEVQRRGYLVQCWYAVAPMDAAYVEVSRDGKVVHTFRCLAYKIWNIPAHLDELLDEMEGALPASTPEVARQAETIQLQAERIRSLEADLEMLRDAYSDMRVMGHPDVLALKALVRALAQFAVAVRFDHSLSVISEAEAAGLVERFTPPCKPTGWKLTPLGEAVRTILAHRRGQPRARNE